MMRLANIYALTLVLVLATHDAVHAADPAPAKGASLDDQLLEGLGGDPAQDAKPAKPPATKPTSDPLDDELLKGLGETPKSKNPANAALANDNPFLRVQRQMRAVEQQIAEAQSGDETQTTQKDIVEQLQKLIEQSQKQQKQKSSSNASNSEQQKQASKDRERVEQSQPSTSRAKQDQPASDSTDQAGKPPPSVKPPEQAPLADVLKRIWGELPPRLRAQMLQSSNEKFVPQYESAIEDYFRSLAAPGDGK